MMVQIINGDNLLKAHRKHIYQLLANEKGISHWKVSFGYGLIQLMVGLGVLGARPFGLFAVMFLLGFFFAHSPRSASLAGRTSRNPIPLPTGMSHDPSRKGAKLAKGTKFLPILALGTFG